MDQREKRTDLWRELLSVFFVALLSFLVSLQASNHIWRTGNTGVDSSVFQYVARVIRSGGMPYRDTFDHKGPLLYLINVLGMQAAEWRGIWVLELLAIFVTFYFMYKLARLCVGRGMSVLLLIISSGPLFVYFEGGNLVEEYAIPFIAVSTYIFADYFLKAKINPLRLIVCGFSFAAILLLRPNMCALWVVMCIGVLVQCIREKQQKALIPFILYFMAGALALLIPVLLWLAVNGAFQAFIDDYILFNALYSSNDKYATVSRRVESFAFFLDNGSILFPICGLSYTWYMKRKYFDLLHLAYLGTALLLICIAGQQFNHYGMILVPALIYPLARTAAALKETEWGGQLSALLVAYLLVSFASSLWLGGLKDAAAAYDEKDRPHFGTQEQEVVDMVVGYTQPDDKILVVGNWDIIYNLSNRFAATKYSYQIPPLSIDLQRAGEFYEEIERSKPKVIVIPLSMRGRNIYQWTCQYVLDHDYDQIGVTSDQMVYVFGLTE